MQPVRVRNVDTRAETPLPQLQESLRNLQPGQKVHIENTKEEILRTRENITKRRHDIPGADSHLDYIEALIMAEAEGKLEFKKKI
jgi:hypothetical protein